MSDTDDDLRTRRNLAATVALLTLALIALVVFNWLDDQRKLQRCLDSGRRDCLTAPAPPPPHGGRM